MVGSAHDVSVGLTFQGAGIDEFGLALLGGASESAFSIRCLSGANDKIDVPDMCDTRISGAAGQGHVVECKFAPPIP